MQGAPQLPRELWKWWHGAASQFPALSPPLQGISYVLAVLLPGEVVQLRVVLLLVLKGTAVLARAQLARVDAVCLQEALVGHAERLPDGLSNDLGLRKDRVRLCPWSGPKFSWPNWSLQLPAPHSAPAPWHPGPFPAQMGQSSPLLPQRYLRWAPCSSQEPPEHPVVTAGRGPGPQGHPVLPRDSLSPHIS